MINIILSYADDETLFKMSQINKHLHKIILCDNSARGKDLQLLVTRYKLRKSQQNLDRVVEKIKSGELVDTLAFQNEQRNGDRIFGELYVQTLALKYPIIARKVTGMKRLDKLILNRRLTNLGEPASPPNRGYDSGDDARYDYMDERAMNDPVQDEVLKFYANPHQSIESFARERYGITAAQLRSDRTKRDQIKMEMYLENYANHGIQPSGSKGGAYDDVELDFQNLYLRKKFQDRAK